MTSLKLFKQVDGINILNVIIFTDTDNAKFKITFSLKQPWQNSYDLKLCGREFMSLSLLEMINVNLSPEINTFTGSQFPADFLLHSQRYMES